jgi:hypothetical protein
MRSPRSLATLLQESPARAAALLLAVPVLLFFGVPLAQGRVFVFRDGGLYYLPHKALIAQALREGRLPQWNPLEYGGLPLLADPNFNVFHPLSLLTHFTPLPQGQMLFLGACALGAAAGARLLALQLGASSGGALVAGLAYCWSGTLLSLVLSGHALAACTLPWVAYAGARAGAAADLASLLVLALAAASAFLAGMPEIGACGLGLGGLLLLSERLARRPEQPPAPLGRTLALFTAAVLLGLGLAAVQLFPTAAFVSASSRAGGFELSEAQSSSLHPLRLLSLPLPFLFGTADAPGVPTWFFPVGSPPYVPEIHAGAVVVLLALLGLGGPGARRRLPLWAGALLLLPLAMGDHTPLHGLLFKLVPLLRMIRYPEKLVVPLALAVAVAAGAGWERLSAPPETGRPRRWLLPAALACALGAGAAALSPSFLPGLFAALGPLRAACVKATAVVSISTELALLALLLAALGLRRSGRLSAQAATLVLAAVVALDLGWPALRLDPSALAAEVSEPSPLVPLLTAAAGLPNWAFRTSVERLGLSDADIDPGLPRTRAVYLVRHAGMFDAGAAPAGFYLDRGYSGFTPGGLRTLFNHGDGAGVLDLLGVRFGVEVGRGPSRFARLGFTLRPGSEGALIRVYQKPAAREKLRLVPTVLAGPAVEGLVPRCHGEEAAWLDPQQALALPASLAVQASCPQAPPAPGGAARIVRYLPEEVEAEVDAAVPALAVLNDTFAPGWTATVDGAPAAVVGADGALRATPVEKGRHTIVWRYRAPGLRTGAAVSGLALVLLGLLGWRVRRVASS